MMIDNKTYLGIIDNIQNDYIDYPVPSFGYSPSKKYPEYKLETVSDVPNPIYDLIRQGLHYLQFDNDNYGKNTWNPLSHIIKPGDTVVVKPNMVRHHNPNPESGINCVVTHPSLVRAVLDYVLIALKNNGKVIIADAPLQDCDFELMKERSGYNHLFEFYKSYGIEIPCVDLRNHKSIIKHGLNIHHDVGSIINDTRIVDLGKLSEFHNIDKDRYNNLRVTNYDPSIIVKHHSKEKNEYAIAATILEADVIINMPKPKTHRYAGLTLSLKNMVGINTNKDYLPHHTLHSQQEGGDAYKKANYLKRQLESIIDLRNLAVGKHMYATGTVLNYLEHGIAILDRLVSKDEHLFGSWHGNDTIWRTILDLNRIIRYSDKTGTIRDIPQRRVFNVADMIISGEKEGPLSPTQKKVGIIAMSEDAVGLDEILATIMGVDYQYIPSISNASKPNSHPIGIGNSIICSNNTKWNGKISSELLQEDCFSFELTSGWKDYNQK